MSTIRFAERPPVPPADVSDRASHANAEPHAGSAARGGPALASQNSVFSRVMSHLANEADAHERALREVRVGGAKALDGAELLALQSDVYRYGQVVELTSKLAEQSTQSVQTVLKSGGQ